jgi:hypothetical protein
MALGAQPASVAKLVIGEGLALALMGMGLGVVAAFGLTRLMGEAVVRRQRSRSADVYRGWLAARRRRAGCVLGAGAARDARRPLDRAEVRLVNASSLLALVRLPLWTGLAFLALALLHRLLFLLMLALGRLPGRRVRPSLPADGSPGALLRARRRGGRRGSGARAGAGHSCWRPPAHPDQWHPARWPRLCGRGSWLGAGCTGAGCACAPDAGCAAGPARAVEVVQRREAPPATSLYRWAGRTTTAHIQSAFPSAPGSSPSMASLTEARHARKWLPRGYPALRIGNNANKRR